jgi:hypothetical protein
MVPLQEVIVGSHDWEQAIWLVATLAKDGEYFLIDISNMDFENVKI